MAVTPTTFVANYPEFAQAPLGTVVQNALNDAYSMTPSSVWPTSLVDQAAQLRAAQSLALSPFGRGMALADDEGKTVYDARLDRLVRIAAAGGTVL